MVFLLQVVTLPPEGMLIVTLMEAALCAEERSVSDGAVGREEADRADRVRMIS